MSKTETQMNIVVEDLDHLTPMTISTLKKAATDAGYDGEIVVYSYEQALEENVYGLCMGALKGVRGVRTLTPKQLFSRGRAYLFLVQAMKKYLEGEAPDDVKVQVVTEKMLRDIMPVVLKDRLVAFDIETAGNLDTDTFASGQLLSMAFYAGGDTAWVIPEELCETDAARDFFTQANMRLVCHNGTFDIPYTNARLGLNLQHEHDTLMQHYVMFNTAQENGLKQLAQRWLHAPDWDSANKQYLKGGAHFENIPRDQLYKYNGLDVYWTFKLHELFWGALQEQEQLLEFYLYRMDVSRMLAQVQVNGVKTDRAKLTEMGEGLAAKAEDCKQALRELAGPDFNPASPAQIKRYFQARGVAGTTSIDKKTKKRKESFDEDALKRIKKEHPEHEKFVSTLLEFRGASKLLSSYIKPLLALTGEDGRVHPHYLPHGTKTGRLSAKTPPIQTIPRSSHIKLGLVAEEGSVIIGCDYSQAELRTVAELSGDDNMIAAFQPGAPDFFDNLMVQIYNDEFEDLAAYEAWKKNNELEAKDRRALIKGIVYGCVPMSYPILTRQGWKSFESLEPGIDETRGIDPETGKVGWTPVTDKVKYNNAPTNRYHARGFDVVTTPQHKWLVRRGGSLALIPANELTQEDCLMIDEGEYVPVEGMYVDAQPHQDVWCPTTGYGTWTTLDDNGNLIITGNTNYGRGVNAIAKALDVPVMQAKNVLDRYYATYPKFADWQSATRAAVASEPIVTPFGLSFHHDIVTHGNRNKVENEALAFVPQSTANDICLHAALEVHKKAPEYGAMIVGLVHDAIYVECPEETSKECAAMVQHEMEAAARLVFDRVPFAAEAEIGTNWEEV